ncbi:MAG: hypothetical protein QOK29_3019 [Rhodospirillaceae bacterium]|nr:hypothetical protein [Rhodospirillaceae bacterium]
MDRTDLTDLSSFAMIAARRSFRRAAAELGMSPSALSHAMRGLEERLGVRLLNRTTRSVAVTEAGERLLARLGPALRDIADAVEEIGALRETPSGTLRLNVPRSAAQLVLLPLVGRFLAAYPEMRLEIIAEDGLVVIVAAGFDAGVRFGESLQGDMIAAPIGPAQRFAVVCSPDYARLHGIPRTPHELHGHECIRHRFSSGAIYNWEFEGNGEAIEIVVEGRLTLNNHDLMIGAARDGLGLACVFENHVRGCLSDGSLLRVLEDWCPPFPGFFIYYPGRRQMPAGLRAFIDMARETYGPATAV